MLGYVGKYNIAAVARGEGDAFMTFGQRVRIWSIAFIGFGGLALAPGKTAAQPTGPAAPSAPVRELPALALDRTQTGEISSDDPTDSARRHFDEYLLPLSEGDVVRIDMEPVVERPGSPVVQSMLSVHLNVPGRRQLAASETRAVGTRNAQIYFMARRFVDTYVVRASGAEVQEAQTVSTPGNASSTGNDGTTGPYRLIATRLSSATSRPAVRALVNGSDPATVTASGEIGAESGFTVYMGDAYRQNLYSFTGNSGDRIRLEMASSAFPASLQLVNASGRVIATASSGLDATARLRAVIGGGPSETYTIRAQGPIDRTGPYVLALTRLAAPPVQPPKPIAVGAADTDELDPATSAVVTGPSGVSYFYRDYALRLQKNEVVTVRLSSTDFDPVLEVGGTTMFGFAPSLTNDDSGDSEGPLNSRLTVSAPERGTATIRVRSLGAQYGAYRLQIDRGESPVPAPDAPTSE